MEARSPFFESTVYKSFALQKVRKTLRLEGAKLTYRKDEGDDVEEGRMRLTASSTVVATSNLHRKRQGACFRLDRLGSGPARPCGLLRPILDRSTESSTHRQTTPIYIYHYHTQGSR